MIIFNPHSPWSHIAAIASLSVIILLLARTVLDIYRKNDLWLTLGQKKRTRTFVFVCSLLTAVCLAIAALNPYYTPHNPSQGLHLEIAVDVSDSVLRAHGGWESIRKSLTKKIQSGIQSIPLDLRKNSTGGILTFRTQINETWRRKPIATLPSAFSRLGTDSFAEGDGTHIENGLHEAYTAINKAGGQGAVILISDGHQTTGDALIAAQDLARQGVPIHVFPIEGRGPAVAITDADLPPQVFPHVQTFVRGMLINRLKKDETGSLSLSYEQNPINSQSPISVSRSISLPSHQWVRFRWPIVFQDFGLQFIQLSLQAHGEKEPHIRRFYTYVKRPPKLLVLGGENTWIQAVPADLAQIETMDPKEPLFQEKLTEYDALVINSTPSFVFPRISLDSIAQAVEKRGLGFLFINGTHEAAPEEGETVLLSYKDSPIAPLLPVIPGPRPFISDPPPRQVAILIDTSGSMEGWKLQKSKEIAKHIIQNLLRPQDKLDLITFTTGAGQLMESRSMDEDGKIEALHLIDSIRSYGGTDPRQALALIGNRSMNECGLIFLSDGEFDYIDYRPDCRATVFEIGSDQFSRSPALRKIADPIPVSINFDPQSIYIPYFDPQPRDKFYEKEPFNPMSMENHLPLDKQLPVPSIELKGSAVSYLKESATLNGVRPKLIDPVLASWEFGEGIVEIFNSGFTSQWINEEKGRKAIEAWISHLIPFIERNRYDFKLQDLGDLIQIRISLVSPTGTIPQINRMTGTIEFKGKESSGFTLQQDSSIPGVFQGQISVERTNQATRGFLILREFGSQAVPRPQRIPIIIPPKGKPSHALSSEDASTGLNKELLQKIANAGGGSYDPPQGAPFFKEQPIAQRGLPLWPFVILAAILFYLAAIALKRIDP